MGEYLPPQTRQVLCQMGKKSLTVQGRKINRGRPYASDPNNPPIKEPSHDP